MGGREEAPPPDGTGLRAQRAEGAEGAEGWGAGARWRGLGTPRHMVSTLRLPSYHLA